jgi:hypothetical protein
MIHKTLVTYLELACLTMGRYAQLGCHEPWGNTIVMQQYGSTYIYISCWQPHYYYLPTKLQRSRYECVSSP